MNFVQQCECFPSMKNLVWLTVQVSTFVSILYGLMVYTFIKHEVLYTGLATFYELARKLGMALCLIWSRQCAFIMFYFPEMQFKNKICQRIRNLCCKNTTIIIIKQHDILHVYVFPPIFLLISRYILSQFFVSHIYNTSKLNTLLKIFLKYLEVL